MLDIKTSTLETWSGPLSCDPAMAAALDADPVAAARLADPNGGPWVGDLPPGATRVVVRALDNHDRLIVAAAAQMHAEGSHRNVAVHVETARRALVHLSDLPDVRPGPDGYPVERLAGSALYAEIVLEISRRAVALGSLGKAQPSPSGTPSVGPQPGAGASHTTAPAATAPATPIGA